MKANSIKIMATMASMMFALNAFAETSVTTTTTDNMPNGVSTTTTESMPSSVTTADDSIISSSIQAKIAQDTSMTGSNLTVTSQNGMVTLNGTVASQAQADAAVSAAKSIPGVKEVQSNVTIVTPSTMPTTNTTTSY